MSKVKIVLNSDGIRQLMQSPGNAGYSYGECDEDSPGF